MLIYVCRSSWFKAQNRQPSFWLPSFFDLYFWNRSNEEQLACSGWSLFCLKSSPVFVIKFIMMLMIIYHDFGQLLHMNFVGCRNAFLISFWCMLYYINTLYCFFSGPVFVEFPIDTLYPYQLVLQEVGITPGKTWGQRLVNMYGFHSHN